jgi:hypothetical protein
MVTKIIKLDKNGVTQIVTPLFKKSYLTIQKLKNHKPHIKMLLKVSRISTKNFSLIQLSIIISQAKWHGRYKLDTHKQTLGKTEIHTCINSGKITIKN